MMSLKIRHGLLVALITFSLSPCAWAQGEPQETHAEEAERYTLLYKEYLEAVNNAESDEERTELRRKFDDETRSYQGFLAEEQQALQARERDGRVQALEDEYQKKVRVMQQEHDQEVRRVRAECRHSTPGADKNWLALEAINAAECQKARSLEANHQRDLKNLEKDYAARLKALQSQ